MSKKYLRFEQMEVFRPMPTKTQEQQERFVDHIQPMPVPAALVERIRKDSEYAKQLADSIGDKKLPEGSKQ